jgi:hypothetical protein
VSPAVFAAIVVVFVVVAVLVIRRMQRGAFVDRLPLEAGETVLLEEEGLKVFHRFRRVSVGGGGTVTHRVRSVLTDRRILLATGGPEGKHGFVILLILDFTTPARPAGGSGYAAYKQRFDLARGYATYPVTAADVGIADDGWLRFVVPFPEAGAGWGDRPEVKISTPQAERYRETIERAGHPVAS